MADDVPTKQRPVTVERAIPVSYDLGNLAVFDENPIDYPSAAEADREEHLAALARDAAQMLVNQILTLPVVTGGGTGGEVARNDGTFIRLPEPTTLLPREKPLPAPKPPTKWEKFAKAKGIQAKEKTGNTVYDETTGEWVRKWGYKGKNKATDSQWLVEVDDKKDQNADPRKLKREERRKMIRKNVKQHEKNERRRTEGSR
ncbi:ribosomal biogenesis regulatory protein [Dipodascopsis tothii]|uniref:ribosomal biogenesis regulatory protein n=1 Tax=Dipodascopsis tothii TaxID=44089 RepID=UPI0034CDA798